MLNTENLGAVIALFGQDQKIKSLYKAAIYFMALNFRFYSINSWLLANYFLML